MSNKRYELLKEYVTPSRVIKAGTIYKQYGTRSYINDLDKSMPHFFSATTVHNAPTWFRLIPNEVKEDFNPLFGSPLWIAYELIKTARNLSELKIKKKYAKRMEELSNKQTPNKKEEFVWADELVLMAIDLAHHNGYHKLKQTCRELFDEIKKQAQGNGYKFASWVTDHVEQSKSSLQPKVGVMFKDEQGKISGVAMQPTSDTNSKDWEIVTYDHYKTGGISNVGSLHKGDPVGIHSVKRLSDGVVFSVGDDSDVGEILGFEILPSGMMMVQFKFKNKDLIYPLSQIIKLPSPQKSKPIEKEKPLFTTEDGVEIEQGNKNIIWRVFIEPSSYPEWVAISMTIPQSINSANEKYFYYKKNAEEYILMNKPCLSVNDVLGITRTINDGAKGHDTRDYLNNKLKELAKSVTNL